MISHEVTAAEKLVTISDNGFNDRNYFNILVNRTKIMKLCKLVTEIVDAFPMA
jgi:hypothetical protein